MKRGLASGYGFISDLLFSGVYRERASRIVPWPTWQPSIEKHT